MEHVGEKDAWCWWCAHDGDICHARGCGCLSHPLADTPTTPELGSDARTHGQNHAPLPDGVYLAPGFCAGCDKERGRVIPPTKGDA